MRLPRAMELRTAQSGFTLIELMIVVSIIGITAAVAIPSLEAVRMARNELGAAAAVVSIASGQTDFQISNGRLAASLAELADGPIAYIDEDLADGEKAGYRFDLELTTSGFRARAHPAMLCETGSIFYSIDETFLRSSRRCREHGPVDHVEPGSTPAWPPESEGCSCPRGGNVSNPIVTQLRLLSPRDVVSESEQWIASSKNVARTLAALDRNGDGKLGLEEIVQGDVLAIARTLAAESKLQGDFVVGPDRELQEVLVRYRAALEAQLVLGAGDEAGTTLVVEQFTGDASKWLQSAPKLPVGMLSDQSARALRELTNLAVAENVAVLRTGSCLHDLRTLWSIAPALRIPGDRYGYDYQVESCNGNAWSVFAQAHGAAAKRPSFRIDHRGEVTLKR